MMWDWISWDFWQQHSLWLMFSSAFLSSTVLPGNSEIVFVALLGSIVSANMPLNMSFFSPDVLQLLLVAVIGNSLGSLTTYWIGRLFPRYQQISTSRWQWGVQKFQQYGIWLLLLSWLPVIGDLFCVLAGWLRLNSLYAFLLISLGKLVRYSFLALIGWGIWS